MGPNAHRFVARAQKSTGVWIARDATAPGLVDELP